MCATKKLRVANCILDCIRLAIPQPTEWQHIGNQINAALIFARADFVNAQGMHDAPASDSRANP